MKVVTEEDAKVIQQLLQIDANRYRRNPTTYFSDLLELAADIIAEHISEDADPIIPEKRLT